MGTISFNNQNINPHLKDRLLLKTFLAIIFVEEKVAFKSVNYIFCTDEYLLVLNQEYLKHDTLTDILTFSYSDPFLPIISEIYISVERVRENADLHKVFYQNELHRVMIHGILHLCGYNDSNLKQKADIRAREDFYLARL
ncbi:MAG: rRNA maturation RNase YbeY [Ginsengibacter sp.]